MAKRAAYSARRADPEKIEAVRETLTGWFRENARDLPWWRTRDPWRVLVSEVMLQQIQVVRAVPFYERFLERFPTILNVHPSLLPEFRGLRAVRRMEVR